MNHRIFTFQVLQNWKFLSSTIKINTHASSLNNRILSRTQNQHTLTPLSPSNNINNEKINTLIKQRHTVLRLQLMQLRPPNPEPAPLTTPPFSPEWEFGLLHARNHHQRVMKHASVSAVLLGTLPILPPRFAPWQHRFFFRTSDDTCTASGGETTALTDTNPAVLPAFTLHYFRHRLWPQSFGVANLVRLFTDINNRFSPFNEETFPLDSVLYPMPGLTLSHVENWGKDGKSN